MHGISTTDFTKIADLFTEYNHHMALKAAVEGKVQALVYADSISEAKVAAACFGVRLLIGGNCNDEYCLQELQKFLDSTVLADKLKRMYYFVRLYWQEDGWKDELLEMLATEHPVLVKREYYQFSTKNDVAPLSLPQGYQVRHIDENLLAQQLANTDKLQEEMCSERASTKEFLEHSFGVCAVKGEEIAGWCLSEYNNSLGCEIGIEVLSEHQRQGLATALTKALVLEAKRKGLPFVGWDCYQNNTPSVATAQRAGFDKVAEYEAIELHRWKYR